MAGYVYEEIKPRIFTEEMQPKFLAVRDRVKRLCKIAGVCTMGAIMNEGFGDSWETMACVDRLVELKEIREIKQGPSTAGQDRIFVLLDKTA